MRVLGMMSGTSADGIDVSIVQIQGAPPDLVAHLNAHHHVAFRPGVRDLILRLANGGPTTTSEVSQLNFLLGGEFARAAIAACNACRIPLRTIGLIGSHGQTIFHQGAPAAFLGRHKIASTLQIGEPSVIAARTGIPTIGDFRPADMAAGGQGAPLVPFVDYLLYRDEKLGRVALNIGGIANATVIPPRARLQDVFAFDTGPGNMVVDALVERLTGKRALYDGDSRMAMTGKMIPALLNRLMKHPYLAKRPPKTAGREQFGRAFADDLFAWAKKHRARPHDLVRTATIFTALSIAESFRRFILNRVRVDEIIVAGGGARNPLMMAQLAAALSGISIVESGQFGIPSGAKEAFAFAVLAYETFHGRANNLPLATGAKRPVVLGKLARGWAR